MARSVKAGEIAGEGAGRLRAGPLAAVHVDRQPQHEADGLALGGDLEQPGGIGLEGLALDGLDAGRKAAVGIGNRNADRLGAEVEADQRAARGPKGCGFDQGEDGGGHVKALNTHLGSDAKPAVARLFSRRLVS